jgi:F-type H+-transporting ATPase subunit b
LKDSRFPLFFIVVLLFIGGALGLTGTASWALQAARAATPSGKAPEPANHAGTAAGAASGAQQSVDAEEQEPGDDVYRHSASVKLLGSWLHLGKEAAARLFEYLNFAILAGAILFALLKYLPKTFRANRETIQHRLTDARTATEQSHERLAAIEQRLSRLDEEIAAISKQAEKDSLEDEARIKASIEAERQRIVEAAGQEITAAASSAKRDLRRFAAELAVDRAVQRIALTEEDDRVLVREFAENLGRQSRGGGRN